MSDSEPLLTRKEKSTLLKVGLGLGAVAWAGPQILGMLFVLVFLALFATVALFAIAGTMLKYGLIAACGVGAVAVVARLVSGPKPRAHLPLDPVRRQKQRERLEKAKLDLELAQAMRDAGAKKR
jgi:hypothetical protein